MKTNVLQITSANVNGSISIINFWIWLPQIQQQMLLYHSLFPFFCLLVAQYYVCMIF